MYKSTKKYMNRQQSKQLTLQEILTLITSKTSSNSKRSGKNYIANCPAHDDKHASLSIATGHDNRILLHCFVGCDIDQICTSLGIKVKDLFPQKTNGASHG